MSLAEKVRSSYPDEKRAWDETYPMIAYVWRPLSFGFSAWLMERGVTANQVTLLTALLGAFSLGAFAVGDTAWRLAGALGIVLYNFLDCVDGNIARSSPPEIPPRGKFFDGLVGNAYTLSYLFLGLGLRGEGGAYISLLLGALATISKYLFGRIRDDFWSILGNHWEAHKKKIGYSPHTGKWYYKLYYNLFDLQGHAVLLPLIVFWGFSLQFLAIAAALSVGEMLFLGGMILRRSFSLR